MTKAEMLVQLAHVGCDSWACPLTPTSEMTHPEVDCSCFRDMAPMARRRMLGLANVVRALVEALPEGDDGR